MNQWRLKQIHVADGKCKKTFDIYSMKCHPWISTSLDKWHIWNKQVHLRRVYSRNSIQLKYSNKATLKQHIKFGNFHQKWCSSVQRSQTQIKKGKWDWSEEWVKTPLAKQLKRTRRDKWWQSKDTSKFS